MSNVICKILKPFSGNVRFQNAIEHIVSQLMLCMGVGFGHGLGGGVGVSGETASLYLLKKQKKKKYVIFDVGANKGQFLSVATSIMDGKVYKIHAFEPSKNAFSILRKYNSKEVVLNNIGLGKKSGEYDLFYPNPGSGLASLTMRELDYLGIEFSMSEKVKIDTLDNYCNEHSIECIDFLKIDVEGHELDVLSGAMNMLDRKAITMVSFEFGGCNISTRTFFYDFFNFFQGHSMKIFRITPNGYLYPIPHYKELYEQFRTTNFLAVNEK